MEAFGFCLIVFKIIIVQQSAMFSLFKHHVYFVNIPVMVIVIGCLRFHPMNWNIMVV